MPASPFLDHRILLLCHTLPTTETPRLWRWIEAVQRLGDLWLLAPAGPSLHLEQWTRLAKAAERLAIEPEDPATRPRRYQRIIEQWSRQTRFQAVVATSPAVIHAIDGGNIPIRLMDVPPPQIKSGKTLKLPFRTRDNASPNHAWTPIAAHIDPTFALEQRLNPRSKAA